MAKYQQPNMANLMKQAQKMQAEMAKAQEELAAREFIGTAGGEAVTVTMSGDKKVTAVTIEPELLNADDAEMLCDMLAAAFNDGLSKTEEAAQSSMGALTGNLKMPRM